MVIVADKPPRLWMGLLLPALCAALYEDQVFKFDWRQQYVGRSLFNIKIEQNYQY